MLEIARQYVADGLSVIPVKADGSKSPAFTGWRAYSNKIADDATLADWFAPGKLVGIGIVPDDDVLLRQRFDCIQVP